MSIVVSKRPVVGTGALQRIPRRAIFVDVENTSSEDDLFEVIDAAHRSRAQPTEVNAVGNWRAISQRLGRRLAGIGALVHSAPATGVARLERSVDRGRRRLLARRGAAR